jgi:Dyp-type peroxidase family
MTAPSRRSILEYAEMQGLILRGYPKLRDARYYLLQIKDERRFKTWLAQLLAGDRVTSAEAKPDPERGAFNIAFTTTGLAKLGVDPSPHPQNRDGFGLEFREGLTQPSRSRMLGDVGPNSPEQWIWGGSRSPTDSEIDCICFTFAAEADPAAPAAGVAPVVALWRSLGLDPDAAAVRHVLHAWLSEDGREPFGFQDGISQPVIRYTRRDYQTLGPERALHIVEPGEFILGYENESGRMPLSPCVPPERDPRGRLRPLENPPRLDASAFAADLRDFGRNGTYLVVRQLRQDVHAFEAFLDRASGGKSELRARLAAQLVGRWPNGAPLVRAPLEQPAQVGDNSFSYFGEDRFGYRCPLGAHVRRGNPRDALADERDDGVDRAVRRANTHRLLRRGRRYGPDWPGGRDDPDAPADQRTEQGLFFICLNTDLRRQFEFVQQNWINNQKFGGLFSERDPLNGSPESGFSIRQFEGAHTSQQLPRFVTVTGGAYFFMPALAALHCLADA